MTTIHWCGTGLSSGPGLRRLLENGHKVVVWNRTVSKAQEVVGKLTTDIRAYSLDALTAALAPGDIAISMLPADQHVGIAKAKSGKNLSKSLKASHPRCGPSTPSSRPRASSR